MKYYLTIKENQISPFVKTWMHLEEIIQNEISQTEKKSKCSVFMDMAKKVALKYP